MKILMLTTMPFMPTHNGSRLRTFNLLKHIVRNHEVTCIAMFTRDPAPSENDIAEMNELVHELVLVERPLSRQRRIINGVKSLLTGRPFTYLNFDFPAFANSIRRAMNNTDFDLVHARHIHTLQYIDLFLDQVILMESEGIAHEQWIMYGREQKSSLFRSSFCLHQAKQLRRVEVDMNRQCDAVISCCERDKKILEALCPEVPNICVPNGVDTEYFTCDDTEEEPHSIVYTSAFDYVPNTDAVVNFARRIFPKIIEHYPDAKLYLVGKDPVSQVRALESDHVIVTGTVDDVRPYVARAQVFVVPLRVGQGTRLKVVEAMSMSKAIVSTSIGAEGISCTNGEDIIIADEPSDMVTAIIRLFENSDERIRLGNAARKLAVEKFEWSLWYSAIDEAYNKAIKHFEDRRDERRV